jgi:hypothetical protein
MFCLGLIIHELFAQAKNLGWGFPFSLQGLPPALAQSEDKKVSASSV